MSITVFNTLFSKSKLNKDQFWSIYVEKKDTYSTIITKYGLVDGKVTVAEKTIYKGKNLDKANQTSHYEQAINEARSKWNKKKDQGYTEKNETEKNETTRVILPMLALDFLKRGKDIEFPCYVQPKLDGVRAILNNGKMQSRTGKFFPNLSLITEELNTDLILDGELYSNTLGFQDIVGIVKKEKINEDDKNKLKEIKFIVYDVILDKDYNDRLDILKSFFKGKNFKYSELHKTEICNSIEKVKDFHKKYVSQGYEGLILRNKLGKYEIKNRSKNLQKYKEFQDDEFKVVNFTDGTGIEKDLVIWICETKEGKTFNVRPQGSHKERKDLYKNGKKYINKYLTVKFFEYTDDKIPRFPVGITFRDYE